MHWGTVTSRAELPICAEFAILSWEFHSHSVLLLPNRQGQKVVNMLLFKATRQTNWAKYPLPALACLQDLGFVSLFMFKACCPILHNRCLGDLYDKGGESLFYEQVAAWLIICFVMIIIFCFLINIVYFNCLDLRNQWNF